MDNRKYQPPTSSEKHRLKDLKLNSHLKKQKPPNTFTSTTPLGAYASDSTLAGLVNQKAFQKQVFSPDQQIRQIQTESSLLREATIDSSEAWNDDLDNKQIRKLFFKEWKKVGNSGKTLLQEAVDRAWAIHDKWVELFSSAPSDTHSDHLIEDYYDKGMQRSRKFAMNLGTILKTHSSIEINYEISEMETFKNLYKELKERVNGFWENNPRPEGLTIRNEKGQIIPDKNLDIYSVWEDLKRSAQSSLAEADNEATMSIIDTNGKGKADTVFPHQLVPSESVSDSQKIETQDNQSPQNKKRKMVTLAPESLLEKVVLFERESSKESEEHHNQTRSQNSDITVETSEGQIVIDSKKVNTIRLQMMEKNIDARVRHSKRYDYSTQKYHEKIQRIFHKILAEDGLAIYIEKVNKMKGQNPNTAPHENTNQALKDAIELLEQDFAKRPDLQNKLKGYANEIKEWMRGS